MQQALFHFVQSTNDGMKMGASRWGGFVAADLSHVSRDRSGRFLLPGGRSKFSSPAANGIAQKVNSERVLVAQPLLPVLNLQHLHSAHSQEWLCYWTRNDPEDTAARLKSKIPNESRPYPTSKRTSP